LGGSKPDSAELEFGHLAGWVEGSDSEQVGGVIASPVERGEDGVWADVGGDVDMEGGGTSAAFGDDRGSLGDSELCGECGVEL
jgi:hypothetical protein